MEFKDRLQKALDDLNNHKRDRNDLIAYYINERLTTSISRYYSELNSSLSYLYNKNPVKVIKTWKKEEH